MFFFLLLSCAFIKIENFAALGYPLRAHDTRIAMRGLDALIEIVETEYRDDIDVARQHVASDNSVTYRGLTVHCLKKKYTMSLCFIVEWDVFLYLLNENVSFNC